MALRVKISVRAAAQTRRAAEWWVANRPSAPDAVGKDVGEAVALLSEQPGIGSTYDGARTLGIRRLYLGRIGYFIYYRECDGTLEVLALWHARREVPPRL
ncbi:MAG: type II toxin-antitoxin system RelE/ParE family toxin [Candidatus Methylophosphatis roskildensis]